MSIIAWFKALIYGPDSSEPIKQTSLVDEKQQKIINLDNAATTAEPESEHTGLEQEQAILMCIQGAFKVINESIDIARRSKNLETTLSRINVAKQRLEEAQNMACAHNLQVEGFAAAKAEIKRIEQALDSGAPRVTEDMPHIGVDSIYTTDARKLLMEATALKKQGQYAEACNTLKKAYSADGSQSLFIEERLRLPMYLLLAGQEEEGLAILNQMERNFDDPISQAAIAKQRTIFQKKASKNKQLGLKTEKEPARIEKPVIKNNNSYDAWRGNQDIVKELEFCASLQLRTPFRVLRRHGETHTDIDKEPALIALEAWEGIWTTKLKSLEEILGVKVAAMPPGKHSSDIGPVWANEYLPFLMAIRKIVELEEPMKSRIDKLRSMLKTCEWQNYVDKHGGIEAVVQKLFPRTIRPMPKLNEDVKKELEKLGLETHEKLALATDRHLLSIKGIGPAKLKAIREHCFDMAKEIDADRVDSIVR